MGTSTKYLLLAILILNLSVGSSLAYAGAVEDTCNNGGWSQQKQQYCDAAKSADEAATADGTLWKVYAGVTAVCTTACAASMMTANGVKGVGLAPYADWACIGTSLGAAATDAIWTKQYMTALMGIVGAGVSTYSQVSGKSIFNMFSADKGGSNIEKANAVASGEASKAADKSTDWGACISAASSAFQMYTKLQDADDQAKTRDQNLAAARSLSSNNNSNYISSGNGDSAVLASAAGGSTASTQSGGTSPASGAASTASVSSCATANANPSNVAATVQCVAATSSSSGNGAPIPISDPRFPDAFQNATGQSLGSFLANAQNPAQALGGALSNSLGPTAATEVAGRLTAMAGQLEEGGIYASAGHGGGGAAAADAGMGDIMSGIMSQFGPKKKEGEKSLGVDAIAFKNQNAGRNLASVNFSPEDRSVSLFERVTHRYASLAPRLGL